MKWKASMALFVPKSPDYVEYNDNERIWHAQASRVCHGFLPTQRPCEIFISKGSHKFWSTWEALQTQKSFWVYKSQSPKIKNHELLICLNHCPHRSLLRGVGCWYPALYVLLQSFTNLTLELRIIYFLGRGPDVCLSWFTPAYVAQLLFSIYSRTWNVSPAWSICRSDYIETLGRPWWLHLLRSLRQRSRNVSEPIWELWPRAAKLMDLNAIKLRPGNSWCLQGQNWCPASRLYVFLSSPVTDVIVELKYTLIC